MLPVLLCCLTTPEMDVGGIAVQVERTHQYFVTCVVVCQKAAKGQSDTMVSDWEEHMKLWSQTNHQLCCIMTLTKMESQVTESGQRGRSPFSCSTVTPDLMQVRRLEHIASLVWTVLPHPSHSLDLAPSVEADERLTAGVTFSSQQCFHNSCERAG